MTDDPERKSHPSKNPWVRWGIVAAIIVAMIIIAIVLIFSEDSREDNRPGDTMGVVQLHKGG